MPANEVDPLLDQGEQFTNSISDDAPVVDVTSAEDLSPIYVFGSTTFGPETTIEDNSTFFSLASTASIPGGTGAALVASHFGAIGDALQLLVDDTWAPGYTTSAVQERSTQAAPPATTSGLWSGRGGVARGANVIMQLHVAVISEATRTDSIAGCMRWDPEQIFLSPMADYDLLDTEYNLTSTQAPTGLLENLLIGQSTGSPYWGANRDPEYAALPASQLASMGITIEYGYETGATTWSEDVAQNSNECNNASDRVWVASTDEVALADRQDTQGRYEFDMVRVRVDGLLWSKY